ncbi:HNH endonuclease [Salinisphaera sp.]|uniref:HNH endonuclease n=1 Tax=Salinisphaera sp. TaxID=1914330 RepID=UPI000C43C530|nr:HNH endonuclease [Salinisphaera sp.]
MKMLRTHAIASLSPHRLPTLGQRANTARRLKTKDRDAQRMRVWQSDPRCAGCGAIVAYEQFELDHVQPLSDGGSTDDSNTQALCIPCHREKTNAEVSERAKRRAGSSIYG